MLVTLLFMLIFYLSALPWASSLLHLRYLSSLAHNFSRNSLYITISTSITSCGLVHWCDLGGSNLEKKTVEQRLFDSCVGRKDVMSWRICKNKECSNPIVKKWHSKIARTVSRLWATNC